MSCNVIFCRYGLEGWIADLPQLHVGRFSHGCGGYVSDGDLVSTGEQEEFCEAQARVMQGSARDGSQYERP